MTNPALASQLEGVVRERTANGQYLVDLAGGHCITVELSAKIKVRLIGIAPGSRVRCEISPVEPGRARISELLGG